MAAALPSAVLAIGSQEVGAASVRQQRLFVAIYHRGPAYRPEVGIFEQPLIREHIAHHEALGERLVAAGPVRPSAEALVGVVLIIAADQAEAEGWLRADPAVRGGVLAGQIREWGASEVRAFVRTRR